MKLSWDIATRAACLFGLVYGVIDRQPGVITACLGGLFVPNFVKKANGG